MRFWRKLSIRRQFLLLGMMFFLLLTLLLFVINNYMTHQAVENAQENIKNTVDRMNYRLSDYADNLNRVMTSLAYDPNVQDFMASKAGVERFTSWQRLGRRLNQLSLNTDGVLSIIVRPTGGNAANGELRLAPTEIENLPDPGNNKLLITPMKEYIRGAGYTSTVRGYTLALRSYSVRQDGPTNIFLGTVYVVMDGAKLGKNLGIANINEVTKYYVLDSNNTVVFSTEAVSGTKFTVLPLETIPEGQVVTVTIDGDQQYAYIVNNPVMRMSLLSITPASSILGSINRIIQLELLIFATLILISIVVFFAFQRSAIQPLLAMAEYVDQVYASQGKRTTRLMLEGSREAGLLSRDFNLMLDSIEALNRRLVEAEIYKKQTEIAMLRSQINPHFLYNTLETIRGIAYSSGNADIARMTSALARVFRYSVKSPEFVKLNDEIDMLKDYLSIQQVRFAGRFSTEIDIAPETADCLLPKMLVQPLVENAIQHGLELVKCDGKLLIRSVIDHDELIITVQDNGAGIDTEAFAELQRELHEQNGKNNGSDSVKIGVVNVHGRIRRYYGDPYGLKMTSEPGKGFTASFNMPVRRAGSV
jgi:two-component system sensor histidine kinase YesM